MNDWLTRTIAPMLASTGKPFDSDRHLFEIKWDGIRALAFVGEDHYRLQGRRLTDRSDRYPEILRGLRRLPGEAILDGEIIVLHEERPSFQRVLAREQTSDPHRARALAKTHPAIFVAFDLLYWNGEPLIDKPLIERKGALTSLLAEPPSPIVENTFIRSEGVSYYEQAATNSLEGIVAKRVDSPYRIGERSEDWQKIKIRQSIDCLLVGTLREAGVERVRSLVLAVHDRGRLRWMGNVGSGLDHRTLLQLQTELGQLDANKPDDLEDEVPGRIRWLKPRLVVRVDYLELTDDGRLRHPSFVGFVDTSAAACVHPLSEAD